MDREPRRRRWITFAELGEELEKALDQINPSALTAGQITTLLNNAGVPVTRDSVKRHLDRMVKAGAARIEYWPVIRNGFRVPKAAHYFSPKRDLPMTPDDDPFVGQF